MIKIAAISLILLGACASDDSGNLGDIDVGCSSEQMYMTGTFEVYGKSAGTVLVENAVVGVQGFLGTKGYTFIVNNPLSDSFALGSNDVAAHPLRYVESTGDGDCSVTGRCDGFIASGGSIDVDTLDPFHATFTLSDLHETDGAGSPGAAIGGSVTGCVFAPQ